MADQGGYQQVPGGFPQQYPPPYPPPQGYVPPQVPKDEPPPTYYQQLPPTQKGTQPTVIVVQQPQVVATTVTHSYVSEYGNGALILAIFASFCVCFFGSLWSLICTVPAIFFALNANTAGATGNLTEAQSQRNLSIGCSVAGIVSSAILWTIIIIIVVATA